MYPRHVRVCENVKFRGEVDYKDIASLGAVESYLDGYFDERDMMHYYLHDFYGLETVT